MQIKVRAWNTKTKEMFSAEEMAEDQLTLLPTGQFINVHSESTRLSVIYPLDVMIPLLYTGRKYEGVEVYKGDIIKAIEDDFTDPLEVFWDEKLDGFAARSLDENHLYQTPLPIDGYKIIGDIYRGW